VVELMGTRKGQMQEMASGVEGGSRVTYTIPTRGLLGAGIG
jgi:predicted membrane GTPase involved in stress response